MNCILLSEKSWHKDLFNDLKQHAAGQWTWIQSKDALTKATIDTLKPDWIFIPHWSYIIPSEIFETYRCVVFHMTDLPFGRGGSPLQNLIVRGFDQTMISAIQVTQGIDTGPVYLKKPLSLLGSAEEIFIRSASVIFEMIRELCTNNVCPVPQHGDVMTFHRRKPEDGDLQKLQTIQEVYDYIRMLDAEGYPKAFIEFGEFRLEFSRASLKAGQKIIADVVISKK